MARDENRREADHGTLLVDLQVGDRFSFDGDMLTVAEPPQDIWGIVEVEVEEWDLPFTGSSTRSRVYVTHHGDAASP